MMIRFKYNQELEMLEVTYSGQITLQELIDFGEQVYKDSSLPRNLKILTDVTKANYEISPDELSELKRNLEKHISTFDSVKAAYVHSKPKETAYAYIISEENTIPNYERNVFSSVQAARSWLLR